LQFVGSLNFDLVHAAFFFFAVYVRCLRENALICGLDTRWVDLSGDFECAFPVFVDVDHLFLAMFVMEGDVTFVILTSNLDLL